MINRIRPRNGGIILHSTVAKEGARDSRVGWSRDAEQLAQIIRDDGGLAAFVHGSDMHNGTRFNFASDDGPNQLWNQVLQHLK